jgi:hypothetical protein
MYISRCEFRDDTNFIGPFETLPEAMRISMCYFILCIKREVDSFIFFNFLDDHYGILNKIEKKPVNVIIDKIMNLSDDFIYSCFRLTNGYDFFTNDSYTRIKLNIFPIDNDNPELNAINVRLMSKEYGLPDEIAHKIGTYMFAKRSQRTNKKQTNKKQTNKKQTSKKRTKNTNKKTTHKLSNKKKKMSTPTIESIVWSVINIRNNNKLSTFKDVVIEPNGAHEWLFNDGFNPNIDPVMTSHQYKKDLSKGIQVHSVRDLLNKGNTFILTTGFHDLLGVNKNTVDYLTSHNKKVYVVNTKDAMTLYNQLIKDPKNKTIAIIHSTC